MATNVYGNSKPAVSPIGYTNGAISPSTPKTNFQSINGAQSYTPISAATISALASLGQKAAQPGGLNNTSSNTLKSTYVAKPQDQTATGGMTVAEYQAAIAKKSQPQMQATAGTNQPMPQPQTPTYPGIVGSLIQNSMVGSPIAAQAGQQLINLPNDNKVNSAQTALAKQIGLDRKQIGDIYSDAIPLEFQQGRAQVVQNVQAQKEAALQDQLQNALTERGQNITGLTSAGGLGIQGQQLLQNGLTSAAGFAQPQLGTIGSQQYYNPLGGTSGSQLPAEAQNFVSDLARQVSSGQMTRSDAESRLSTYGVSGLQALNNALGTGFNTAQSNALAGQQGTIGPALQYARTALSNLKNTLTGLQIPGQGSNAPLINNLATGFSSLTGVGGQETAAKNAAVAEARQAIQSVLASVRGGTPTDYTGQSYAILPDNATPQQIDAAIQTLESLGTAKQDIYGNPGQSNSNANSTNNPPGWF